MFKSSLKIRFLSLFVVAFVCLNAGGAACVAYCQTFDIAAEPEHCPLKKLSEHCDKSEEGEAPGHYIAVKSGETDCCPMTVSFFAGPVEKHVFSIDQAPVAEEVQPRVSHPVFGLIRISAATFNYRGPPPLDRRVERIKHRLLRI